MSEPTTQIPYIHLLQGRDAAEVMRTTPARLDSIFAALSMDSIEVPPAPGKWSVREQTCHMADCEVAWAWRLRQTFGENNPLLQSFEQDPWARAYSGRLFTFSAALHAWKAMRDWNLAFIDALNPEDKARPAMHPSAGPITLWTLVEIAAGHDLHHLASFERLPASHT